MDEEITIEQFVNWCFEGFARAGVNGEVLLIDSSQDQTPRLALSLGARVLRVPRKGLGRAYRDAIPFVRGQFVLMGDADCTYDFREIDGFVTQLRSGSQFVMGSRFRGNMQKGAMPLHHKYFGSPLTTLLADILFRLKLTDIHSGMRGLSTDALKRIDLKADGWEYASEMIVNAVRQNIEIDEIAINFFRDVEGRESHVKRQGWTTPFIAGWKTVETLLVHAADFFLIPPGVALSSIGSLLVLLLSMGPAHVADTTFTLNTMVVGLGVSGIGYICLAFGIFARCFYDRTGDAVNKWRKRLPFTRTTFSCITGSVFGGGLFLLFLSRWNGNSRKVDRSLETSSHVAVLGLTMLLASISVFITMLLIGALLNDRKTS